MKEYNEGFQYQVKIGEYHRPGITRQGEDICFTVAVPDGKRCSLLLYEKGSREVAASIPMGSSSQYGDLRSVEIGKLPMEAYEYNYLVDGQVVTDPYAHRIAGREQWGVPVSGEGSIRGCIVNGSYDWEGDRQLQLPYEEIVAYSTHVRGFTRHGSSGVRAKGTFRGVAEKIPYLKKLGINQLELMPVYEFAEVEDWDEKRPPLRVLFGNEKERMNYWGYGTGYYFAPKASYAASGDPVRELKDLVKQLHKNEIELILEFYFPKGIRTALVLDCIRYWVLEYHIDGIHVNRDGTPVEALAQEPLLSHTKIMTESFGLDEIYEERYTPAFRNLAEYHDAFLQGARRFLKGDEGELASFIWRARRNPDRCAVMNYLAGHNGFTLMDTVSYDEKHNEANGEKNRDGTDYNYSWNCGEEGPSRKKKTVALRARQLRNAFLLLLLSQGTPLIYGGDERGNSQSGNNNVYCQDNELSWINWKPGKAWEFLPEYVEKLIAFRAAHPVFRQKKELCQTDYLSCGYPDVSYHGKRAWFGDFENYSRSVGILYAGEYVAANSEGLQQDDSFYVACNMHWIPHEFALPGLPDRRVWSVAIDSGVEGAAGICSDGEERSLEDQRTVTVPGRTILVLRGKKEMKNRQVEK
ncbi:hypothetical protein H8S44_09950 [Anaerosacchariphilus sp. NSJ-68]|uniref:Glycosyl hydrolase family 13 catalytic domain-containing protein n=2 Tax=Lachnospiraceae TaxID=186803 RepID=A0A923LCP1_9FIRM|nr:MULTISPECIES: alpha-amylase family glycosyl hydrolase [Lachnospiraceae]MBC5660094.1 hypothetical protein [Anaerosacchariphilus hominis]MBC5699209.1 hypothetical protein [Roseburia difficilis]